MNVVGAIECVAERVFFGVMKSVLEKLQAAVKLGNSERQLLLFVGDGPCPTLFRRNRIKSFELGIDSPARGSQHCEVCRRVNVAKFSLSSWAHFMVLPLAEGGKAAFYEGMADRERALHDWVLQRMEFEEELLNP